MAALAQAEGLTLLPPPFPATLTVSRMVTGQALVAFVASSRFVPPRLAATTVTVTRRVGQEPRDIVAATGAVLARHHRHPDGAGALVRAAATFTT